MTQKYALEISVETLETARAAERGGADRLELCGNLSVGGVTPSAELMRIVREQVRIPIFVMIRPRAGDFIYSDAEFAEMKHSIVEAKKSRMHGVVLGVLTKDHRIDVEQTRALVEFAKPLPVTYHRAFDEARDLRHALEDVIKTGASRILTSGGAKTAAHGAVVLFELVAAAENRIIIVPGAGNNAANISLVAQKTGAREFHSGLSTALPYGSHEYKRFEEEVRRMAGQLARISPDKSPSS
jgi:copper homeostasis protein